MWVHSELIFSTISSVGDGSRNHVRAARQKTRAAPPLRRAQKFGALADSLCLVRRNLRRKLGLRGERACRPHDRADTALVVRKPREVREKGRAGSTRDLWQIPV